MSKINTVISQFIVVSFGWFRATLAPSSLMDTPRDPAANTTLENSLNAHTVLSFASSHPVCSMGLTSGGDRASLQM